MQSSVKLVNTVAATIARFTKISLFIQMNPKSCVAAQYIDHLTHCSEFEIDQNDQLATDKCISVLYRWKWVPTESSKTSIYPSEILI